METLKELKEKCTLIAEHKQFAFVVRGFNECSSFNRRPPTCKLFTDNKGTFYVYKYIQKSIILKYTNYIDAYKTYCNFIIITCK